MNVFPDAVAIAGDREEVVVGAEVSTKVMVSWNYFADCPAECRSR
jgi:hypothetical protein